MPIITASVIGLNGVITNIKGEKSRLAAGCARGLKKAGLMLQRESVYLVPVDFGPLKASAYTRAEGTGFNTVVAVGYTASYALRVHELVAMKLKGLPRQAPSRGNYWDPAGRGQAKFLEQPVRAFGKTLYQVVTDEMKK